jgi:hypothetical protein
LPVPTENVALPFNLPELCPPCCRTFHCQQISSCREWRRQQKEWTMDGNIVGFAAVVMALGIPMAAMYTYFRVRRLRTEERLAAIARGVTVPMEPELSQAARSRRAGILLTSAAIGYTIAFLLVARVEPDAMVAAAFGVIPFAVGLGFFLDSTLIRRDLRPS